MLPRPPGPHAAAVAIRERKWRLRHGAERCSAAIRASGSEAVNEQNGGGHDGWNKGAGRFAKRLAWVRGRDCCFCAGGERGAGGFFLCAGTGRSTGTGSARGGLARRENRAGRL